MSFRLADLKKSVRKGKEGYGVSPVRLEGRPHAFRIEFVLQQLDAHLGCPRRTLDPAVLLDFLGESRLGRGLLATLTQWYRVRPQTMAEVLERRQPGHPGTGLLLDQGIASPVDLRARLFFAVNRGGKGFLAPETASRFWKAQSDDLGIGEDELSSLLYLDAPEEAILVRTGPRPAPADVMAAYNARALTTLLRSAAGVTLRCTRSSTVLDQACQALSESAGVETRVEGSLVTLPGRCDALGCWTRYGRRVERTALELIRIPELGVRELRGHLDIAGRPCSFLWKADTLALLGAGTGSTGDEAVPGGLGPLAGALRSEREKSERLVTRTQTGASGAGDIGSRPSGSHARWTIRQAAHVVAVDGAVFLPQLELRHGDIGVYLRLSASPGEKAQSLLQPFQGKTPVVLLSGFQDGVRTADLHLPGELPIICPTDGILAELESWLARLRSTARQRQDTRPEATPEPGRSLRPAA